jgi:phytoene dehydrogenase-like protein
MPNSLSKPLSEFDVIVIGSGHNGLVSAAYLAKAGLKVGIVERRPVIGGSTVTEELWPGFQISRASYVPSILDTIVQDLELEKYGFKTGLIDPQDFTPFPNGKFLFTWFSNDQTAKEIEKFSKRDAAAFLKFAKFASTFAETVEPLLLTPPPPMSDLLSLMKGDELEEVIRQVLMTSCKDLLDELFESDEVKAALCMHGILNTSMGVETVGTSYILALSVGERTYKYAIGGMGSIPRALSLLIENHGGIIFPSSEVKQILVQDGRATGVELVSGEKMEARIVVSNADPKRTFLKLVGRDYLDDTFIRRVESLRAVGTSFKINIALSEPLNFTAFPGTKIGPQHKALTDICPSMAYAEKAYDECKWGRLPKEPPLNIFSQTAWDSTVAPPGRQTLSIIAKYNPYHLSSSNWEEMKQEALDNALNVLEAYTPNVRKSVSHIEALSPLDLERIFGLTEGNVTHIDQTPNQMLSFRPIPGWARYRTPIRGLYLCGAGTHPGGGVTGAPGYNAAQAVLEDWAAIKAE